VHKSPLHLDLFIKTAKSTQWRKRRVSHDNRW